MNQSTRASWTYSRYTVLLTWRVRELIKQMGAINGAVADELAIRPALFWMDRKVAEATCEEASRWQH